VEDVMSRRRFDDFKLEEDEKESLDSDPADRAFWDEFWKEEGSRDKEDPLVTIIIRNQETGEEKVVENVRLRFRSLKKLRG
jgi:hypothetical protein